MNYRLKLILSVIIILSIVVIVFFYVPVSHKATFKDNEEITLLIYEKGSIKREITFPPNGKWHAILNKWLELNSENWSHSLNSYAPSIYIISKDISINLYNGFSVINYAHLSNGKHTQIVKSMGNNLIIRELIESGI